MQKYFDEKVMKWQNDSISWWIYGSGTSGNRKGRNTKDFGTGFYCTIIKEQAQRWAKRYDTKIVSIYDVRLDSSLKIKDFREMTDEWLDFIINCRAGKIHDYDIVIGAMADDQIYNYVSDYMDGSITREQFWVLAKFKYPTHQINFCSKRSTGNVWNTGI